MNISINNSVSDNPFDNHIDIKEYQAAWEEYYPEVLFTEKDRIRCQENAEIAAIHQAIVEYGLTNKAVTDEWERLVLRAANIGPTTPTTISITKAAVKGDSAAVFNMLMKMGMDNAYAAGWRKSDAGYGLAMVALRKSMVKRTLAFVYGLSHPEQFATALKTEMGDLYHEKH